MKWKWRREKFVSMVEWIDNVDKREVWCNWVCLCADKHLLQLRLLVEKEKVGQGVWVREEKGDCWRRISLCWNGCWDLQWGWLCGSGDREVTGICCNCERKGWTFDIVGVWIVNDAWLRSRPDICMHHLLCVVEWVVRQFWFGWLWYGGVEFVVDGSDFQLLSAS